MFNYEITITSPLEVWGNAKDGWEVIRSKYQMKQQNIAFDNELDEESLLKLLKKEGLIKKTAKVNIDWLNIDYSLRAAYISEARSEYPICSIYYKTTT
jgi:hypothetical protein